MELTDAELAELYERYAHVLFHRCRSILKNDEDAHDAVHETFARVLRNSASFRRQASPLTWMYTISTNYCLNQIRNSSGRRQKLEHRREELTGRSMPAGSEEAFEDHERLLALLEGADEQTRACVVYTFFDDCTRSEVAKLVGLSVPTVRKRIGAFLDRARRELGVAAIAAVAFLLSLPPLPGSPP